MARVEPLPVANQPSLEVLDRLRVPVPLVLACDDVGARIVRSALAPSSACWSRIAADYVLLPPPHRGLSPRKARPQAVSGALASRFSGNGPLNANSTIAESNGPRVAPGSVVRPEPLRVSNSCSASRECEVRVMGVDPGLTRCGLSVVESRGGRQIIALDVDVVRTPADEQVPRRLLAISDAVEHWLDTHHPDVIAIERVFPAERLDGDGHRPGRRGHRVAGGSQTRHRRALPRPARSKPRSPAMEAPGKRRSPRWSPESLGCKPNRHQPTPPTRWRWRSVTAGARR